MNIWGNWRQREGTGGVENVITKHGVGRSEDEMADKTSQRKHKYISLKTNICLIDTNISWTIQIFIGAQQNVMRKQEVGRWKDEMGDKSSSMERQLSSWQFNATLQFLPDEILTLLLPVSLGSRTIFWVKISLDIFHELAGEREIGRAEYKLATRAACQQNYSSFIGELQDEKEKQTNLIERKIKKVSLQHMD